MDYKGIRCTVVHITRRYRLSGSWIILAVAKDEYGKRHSVYLTFNRLWDFLTFKIGTQVNLTDKE